MLTVDGRSSVSVRLRPVSDKPVQGGMLAGDPLMLELRQLVKCLAHSQLVRLPIADIHATMVIYDL